MAKKTGRISLKQVMIDKSNSRMVMIAGIAAFVAVFSLVASKSLMDQRAYNDKVIGAKKETLQQLEANLNARDQLVRSYTTFQNSEINVIGGSSAASGGNNGDNASIVTDSLPFRYDFPALTTSLEKMIITRGLSINTITGTDDAVAQQMNLLSAAPEAVPIPFEIGVTGAYADIQLLINDMQKSIRPFVIQNISLTASEENNMTATITAQTFYQPSKELTITKEVIQ